MVPQSYHVEGYLQGLTLGNLSKGLSRETLDDPADWTFSLCGVTQA